MYKISTVNKEQANKNLELIQERRIELEIQKAQNLADIFYYDTLKQ